MAFSDNCFSQASSSVCIFFFAASIPSSYALTASSIFFWVSAWAVSFALTVPALNSSSSFLVLSMSSLISFFELSLISASSFFDDSLTSSRPCFMSVFTASPCFFSSFFFFSTRLLQYSSSFFSRFSLLSSITEFSVFSFEPSVRKKLTITIATPTINVTIAGIIYVSPFRCIYNSVLRHSSVHQTPHHSALLCTCPSFPMISPR